MNLNSLIESAEHQFKQILEEYFLSVYNEKSIPSHGISHHRRVWNYAKELILIPGEYLKTKNIHLPSLIIACYLHDTGMSVDPGKKHGMHSLNICREFLRQNNLDEIYFPGLLNAILDHDNKEYRNITGKSDLLTILSIADDLDAFGFKGIYRYIEIYHLRNHPPETFGHDIRENASVRYLHFEEAFRHVPSLIRFHKERYETLDEFFRNYVNQISSCRNGDDSTGYCGVVEMIKNAAGKGNEFESFINSMGGQTDDPIIRTFIDNFRLEGELM